MAYIGKIPAAAALTADDITDGIISNAKLAQDIISGDTALAATPADTDEFLVSDAGTLKRVDYSYIKGGGITQASQWRLTTSFTGGASPISSNWEETDNKYSRIGDAFSESSGIFTFPETGIYLITFQGRNNYNGAYAYYEVIINGSDDNFSSSNIIAGNTTSNAGGANRYSGAFTTALFDVTNTSNDKVSFRIATDQSSVTTAGDTTSTMTGATFIRLGDT